MAKRSGRGSQLRTQTESTYRTAPGTPDTKVIRFESLEIGTEENRAADNTVDNDEVLANKTTVDSSTVSGSISGKLCLNDIGQLLTYMMGAPVTTGTGPYTHTWTLTANDPPSFLAELAYTANSKFPQFLGMVIGSLKWPVKDGEANFEASLIGAIEVDPEPTTAFDATPTELAKNLACSKGGQVYDVFGASTLGSITSANVEISIDPVPYSLADGVDGYGVVQAGTPYVKGSLSGLFDDSANNLFEHGKSHTSKALTLISRNKAGDHSLKVSAPAVEFGRSKHKISTSKGLVVDGVEFMAHSGSGAVTVELVNGVPSYA